MDNKNQLGITVGIFAALLHLLWAILVAAGIAQTSLDWIFPMHFINSIYTVAPFNFTNTIILVVLGLVGGYICGWILGAIYNWAGKCCKKK